MTADDHLSGDQFNILQKHRLVQLGSRTYPAVRTMQEDPDHVSSATAKAAWIPSENGALTRVAHFSDDPGKYHLVHQKDLDSAGSIMIHGGMKREEANGIDDLHKRLDAASTRTVPQHEIEHNRSRMAEFRKRAD